jgi:hypothetical protein
MRAGWRPVSFSDLVNTGAVDRPCPSPSSFPVVRSSAREGRLSLVGREARYPAQSRPDYFEEIRAVGLYDPIWQGFAVQLPVRSVAWWAVTDDDEHYAYAIAL